MALYRVTYKLIEDPRKGELWSALFDAVSLLDAQTRAEGIISQHDSPGKFEITGGPEHIGLPAYFKIGSPVDV